MRHPEAFSVLLRRKDMVVESVNEREKVEWKRSTGHKERSLCKCCTKRQQRREKHWETGNVGVVGNSEKNAEKEETKGLR